MLWKNRRQSGNILDQRGFGGKALGAGGLIVGAIVITLLGGNPIDFIARNSGMVATTQQGASVENDEQKNFSAVVLADTEDVWNAIFEQNGLKYREPKMVLFSGSVQSACGHASSAVGPFYCPGDERLYLDLGFFKQLTSSLGAGGDFANAYVIAHEVGHHVQNQLGIERSVRQQQARLSERGRNQLSVQMELQADCFAGVWARHTQDAKNVVEKGDFEEALTAASAVGDDRLQKAAHGEVVPDSFTHGSSEQRVQAFRLGFEGQVQHCLDSYSAAAS